MTFYALGNLQIRTLKPNRFKNQSSDTLKLLGQNCNHQQGLIKQKTVVLHHRGFKLKFPKHCYCDCYYRWNSSYWRLEQYWVRWLRVHSSLVIKLLFLTKIDDLLRGIFSWKFHGCDLNTQNSRFRKKSMKMQFQKKYVSAVVLL